MTGEELLELIGRVDDDLIQEAETFRPARRRGLPDWWKPLAGGAAACLLAAVLLHLPQGAGVSGGGGLTADASSQSQSAGGAAEGEGENSASASPGTAAQERLDTPQGEYRLTGEIVSALPEGSRQLGVLFLEGEVSQEQLYTQKREYAGCMLWEGPDGMAYVQLPGGGYALAESV